MSAQILHGGGLDAAIAQFGGAKEDWLDLSTGINPNAYPLPDLPERLWQRLPDQGAEHALLESARRAYGVPEDFGIFAANGTQALIELLPRTVSSERIAIVSPTYQEHELSWVKEGRHVAKIRYGEALPLLSNGLVVVNPNNPDGQIYSPDQLGALAEELELRHGWLIIDEAFCDPQPDLSFVPHMRENVIVLRSFGKFFGLAGLRLGFIIAAPKIVTRLSHLVGPWGVAGPALEIGRKALDDEAWTAKQRQELPRTSDRLATLLHDCGLAIVGQNPLFVLAEHENAREIHEVLCRSHILTRRFPDQADRLRFGLCRDDTEFQRLSAVLKEATA